MKELYEKLLAYFRANGVMAVPEAVDDQPQHSLTHYYYMIFKAPGWMPYPISLNVVQYVHENGMKYVLYEVQRLYGLHEVEVIPFNPVPITPPPEEVDPVIGCQVANRPGWFINGTNWTDEGHAYAGRDGKKYILHRIGFGGTQWELVA